jgi:hypothetical protein
MLNLIFTGRILHCNNHECLVRLWSLDAKK